MENPIYKCMITRGTHMTLETSKWSLSVASSYGVPLWPTEVPGPRESHLCSVSFRPKISTSLRGTGAKKAAGTVLGVWVEGTDVEGTDGNFLKELFEIFHHVKIGFEALFFEMVYEVIMKFWSGERSAFSDFEIWWHLDDEDFMGHPWWLWNCEVVGPDLRISLSLPGEANGSA